MIYLFPGEEYDRMSHGPWMDTERPMIERQFEFLKEWTRAERKLKDNPTRVEFMDDVYCFRIQFPIYCDALGWNYWQGHDFVEYMLARPKERDAISVRQSLAKYGLMPNNPLVSL